MHLDLPPVIVIKGTETVSYQVPTDWRLGFDGAAVDFVDGLLAGRQPSRTSTRPRACSGCPWRSTNRRAPARWVAPESVA